MSAYPCKHCGAKSPLDARWCHICDSAFMTPDPEADRSDAPEGLPEGPTLTRPVTIELPDPQGRNIQEIEADIEAGQEPKEGGAANV